MFCTSRNVIGRLAWADADIAIAADAPMTMNARQREERRELHTVGMEEGEKAPRRRLRKGPVWLRKAGRSRDTRSTTVTPGRPAVLTRHPRPATRHAVTACSNARFSFRVTAMTRSSNLAPLPDREPARPGVDSTLVNRAKLGDIKAFEQIVERYFARCMRFALGMLRDPAEADDVVQETFVRLYRALPRYEERQRFDSWLFRILGNCCRTANLVQQRRDSVDARDEATLLSLPSADRTDAVFDYEWG